MFGGVSQEFLRLAEWPCPHAFGGQQIMHGLQDGRIIVDQTNFRFLSWAGAVHAAAIAGASRTIAGKCTMMRAPLSLAFSPTMVPPCASMMERTIASPIPMP